ncbi:hypothetical protein FHT05_001150 [Xanthomonas arboricola]|nr:hypothetical protein [Xanthomonas arboricola]
MPPARDLVPPRWQGGSGRGAERGEGTGSPGTAKYAVCLWLRSGRQRGRGSALRLGQTSCLTRRRGTSLCRSPPIPGHAAASARHFHDPEILSMPMRRGLKPLSCWGEEAQLARHGRACLGAPAPQARAGARSGGWGEGTGAKPTRICEVTLGGRHAAMPVAPACCFHPWHEASLRTLICPFGAPSPGGKREWQFAIAVRGDVLRLAACRRPRRRPGPILLPCAPLR